jgi:DNA ligase (NAD+)
LNFNNIANFLGATEDDLLEINDIGPVASKFILEFLSFKGNMDLIEDLLQLGVNPQEIRIENNNPFSSKSVVITGSFTSIARSQLKEELIRVGARVASSVSAKTDFLVVGENPGSKLKKANELEIDILEEEEALKLLQE